MAEASGSPHCAYRADLPLSGPALVELTGQVLARGVPFRFCARGASMFPFIRDGDVIALVPLRGRLPRFGEIAAYIHPETQRLVVHRVVGHRMVGHRTVGRSRSACLLQGDNRPGDPDGWIPPASLLGVVSQIERSGRRRRLGLGPERCLVAFLSRTGLLGWLMRLATRLWRALPR